jgi:prevent-host-death family protein
MTYLSTTEARLKLSKILNRVEKKKQRIILQSRGKDRAALIPMEELKFLERAIEAEEDRLDLAAARAAEAEIKEHGTIPLEVIKKELGL